jgi:hypothetical protein
VDSNTQLALTSLILQVQTSVRTDIQNATAHISERIDDLKERQIAQNGRVNKHEALIAALQNEAGTYRDRLSAIERGDVEAAKAIARLDERSKGTIRSFVASLSPKQKTVFWGAVTAGASFVAERGWQIAKLVLTLTGKGVPTP